MTLRPFNRPTAGKENLVVRLDLYERCNRNLTVWVYGLGEFQDCEGQEPAI